MVLGLGYATPIPDNGVPALKVADVDGVRLADFLVDVGPVNSETLVEIGPHGASKDHSANPITVQDVFVRIGGAGAGKATTSMVINSRHTVVDRTWVWRAVLWGSRECGGLWHWAACRAELNRYSKSVCLRAIATGLCWISRCR